MLKNFLTVDYDGDTQYEFYKENFKDVPEILLLKFSKNLSNTSVYYSTYDVPCNAKCPENCPDKLLAFEMRTGMKLKRSNRRDSIYSTPGSFIAKARIEIKKTGAVRLTHIAFNPRGLTHNPRKKCV